MLGVFVVVMMVVVVSWACTASRTPIVVDVTNVDNVRKESNERFLRDEREWR